jgi:glycosyltransferase involved in cell wall biosynthesis
LRLINDRPSAEAFFVANGIESEPAYAAESTERMQGPDRVTRARVCFAGRCVEKKGLSLIHEAAMEFPEVEFTIAGEGPIDPERWGLPNVKCLGWIGRAALHRLFRESDLLLLPSRGEGFPLTVQEAMAAGTPGAIFEETWRAWGDDRSKFHILSDEHYLVDLRKILDAPPDPARRQEISEYAIRNWTWERAAKTYAQVLHKAHRDSQRIIPNLVQAVS